MILRFDQGTLVLEGLSADRAPAADVPFVWDDRVRSWRCEAIHYARARAALGAAAGEPFVDQVAVPEPVSWPAIDLPALRPEQEAALAAWDAAGRRGLVVMPTGTGKTEVALAAMAAARVAALVVAPVRDLMYQWQQRIHAGLGYDAGIIGDQTHNLKPVTVTTYDSAYIHMARLGDRFGLVVFDEVHHLPGKVRREAALLCAAPWRLGLTATPERSDGLHADLDRLVGPVAYRLAVKEVKGRSLADYHVVRIPVRLQPAEQAVYDEAGRTVRAYMVARRQEDPDFTWQKLLAEVATDPAARAAQKAYYRRQSIENRALEKLRVLEDLFRLHVGERVIVFAGSNAMAMDVSRRFLVPTILSHTRKQERKAVLAGFAEGRLPVLVANQVLDEGVDVPAAKVAVVIGGHASTRQAKQRLGRILRPAGAVKATLYEVLCVDTKDVTRSRKRRKSDAFEDVDQFRIAEGQSLAYGRPRHRRV